MNTLDTAATYGNSEEVLGAALEETGLCGKFNVITKTPIFPIETSEADAEKLIRESLERSLKRLRITKLAAVLIHNEQNLPFFPILERIVSEGYAEGAGISLDTQEVLTRFQDIVYRAKFVQVPSNLLDRRFDAFIDSAPARGALVFARSAYLQGALLMPINELPPYLQGLIPWREKLEKIALNEEMTLKELCFRYLISLFGVTSVVFGVDNQLQIVENVSCAKKGALDPAVVEAVRSSVPLLDEHLIRPSLWGKR